MKKIQILLSVYNGEKYVESLVDSLLNQDYKNIEILIRDDGSNDSTMDIIKKYASFENLFIVKGRNVGVVQSFFKLLQMSSLNAEYFAFCDQDDIWKKDKISRAVGFMEKLPQFIPSMYCSRSIFVDEKLNIIGLSRIPRCAPSFKNALIQNISTGCTIVINKVSRQLLFQKIPQNARMHDFWIYLVISAFGEIIYDVEPRILRRQHSSNVIGIKRGTITARIQRILKDGGLPLITKQAEEFRKIYGSFLTTEKKTILDRFIDERKSFIGRLRYAFSAEVHRQSIIENTILRLLIILNRV